jgi:hypothetical protein
LPLRTKKYLFMWLLALSLAEHSFHGS